MTPNRLAEIKERFEQLDTRESYNLGKISDSLLFDDIPWLIARVREFEAQQEIIFDSMQASKEYYEARIKELEDEEDDKPITAFIGPKTQHDQMVHDRLDELDRQVYGKLYADAPFSSLRGNE